MKILKAILITLISCLALLAIATYGLLYTQAGLNLSIHITKSLLPGTLTTDQLNGTLAGTITARNITYQTKQQQLHINNLQLRWHPFDLLRGRIHIIKLHADKVAVKATSSSEASSKPLSLPSWRIRLNNISIHRLHIDYQKRIIDITNIELNSHFNQSNVAATIQASIKQPKPLNINFKLAGQPQRYRYHLHITGHHINWQLQGSGNQHATRFQTRLSHRQQHQFNINGNLSWKPKLTFAIDATYQHRHNKVHLSGGLQHQWHFSWKINALKLSDLSPFASGQLSSQGKITGGYLRPYITASFTSQHLRYGDNVIGAVNGQIATDINIANFDMKHQLKQIAAITQLNLKFNKANIQLRQGKLVLSANRQQFNYQGSIKSGKGSLTIYGSTKLHRHKITTQLNINGSNFQVYNTRQLQLKLSPQLIIKADNNAIHINGKVRIPSANIAPHDYRQVTTLPDDVVFVSSKTKAPRAKPIKLFSTIHLIMGKSVLLNYQGAKGRLAGQLTIIDHPQQPTAAKGQIRLLNGSYNIYNQHLTISQGHLSFLGGPITNPTLNIRASRKIRVDNSPSAFSIESNDIVVGVDVTGTLQDPKIKLFSSPSNLSQSDILSYLVLGQPVSQAAKNKNNTAILLQAASTLSVGSNAGAGSLTTQLRKTLGLSTLAIETAQQQNAAGELVQNTSLVLGKYITPRLYVDYSIGLIEHTNILRVRYYFNKNWSIQTDRSDLGTGADLLFHFESN